MATKSKDTEKKTVKDENVTEASTISSANSNASIPSTEDLLKIIAGLQEQVEKLSSKVNEDEEKVVNQVVNPVVNTVKDESSARTGNVKKSYVDFTKGTVKETHLQIETELKMSDLRRQGALGVAEFALMALETFNNKKFAIVMDMIDGLIAGGDNAFECTGGSLTLAGINDFTGYLNDHITEGSPLAIGLSNIIRKVY